MTPAGSADALLDALHARRGIVCFVGAGGKKTTLYRVAAASRGRIGITATAHIQKFDPALPATVIVAPQAELAEQIRQHLGRGRIAYAQPSLKEGRLAGLDPEEITRIHRHCEFDVTLVKADGARGRLVKAPNATEPPFPSDTTTVVPLISIQSLGRPLDERTVHRVDRFAAVAAAVANEPITLEHLARLLASDQGALKDVGTATVVPVINMVESPAQRRAAQAIAEQALAMTRRYDHIVIASMQSPDPLVATVFR